jgi:hypothetical protein
LQGDILFLHMSSAPIRAGEIVVFNIDGRDIPIVHRVIRVHEKIETGEVDVLTKGGEDLYCKTVTCNKNGCQSSRLTGSTNATRAGGELKSAT